jgi:hypothetical protein
VVAALAAGELSESYGRTICQWTDRLPEDCREAADAILLSAATAGMDLRDLAGLAAEMYERSRSDLPDEDPARAFEDRAVRLETTFQGAGVLTGDLTPECAAVVGAVLDALSAPAGAEDDRSHAQRYHDGLHEAMRRLLAAGLLPERAGQPVRALVHVSLADLMRLDGGCDQPAGACEVHHLRHRANGGPTSVKDCALFCFYHHQIVIHQWAWTVVLNRDGTTTAWNKDKTKIIHSHGPPARPG